MRDRPARAAGAGDPGARAAGPVLSAAARFRGRLAYALAGLLALGSSAAVEASAMGRREGAAMTKKVTGTVSVVGAEPFTQVVVTLPGSAPRRQVLVLGPFEKTLREGYQGRTVTLEGVDCRPSRPGFEGCITPTRIIP